MDKIKPKFIFGAKNNKAQPFYFKTTQTHITDLCNEVILKIFTYNIPDYSFDFNELLKLRLVCHFWKTLIDNPYIWIEYAKDIDIFNYLYNKYTIKCNLSNFLQKKYQLNNINDNSIINSIFNRQKILDFDVYNKILRIYPQKIINAVGLEKLVNAPVLYINNLCLDHVCGQYCCENNHFLHDKITAPIMRGLDNTGRPFILFVYKNLETNELVYEFIYNNFTHNYKRNRPVSLWTYMGQYTKTYIGNLSHKKSYFNPYENSFQNNINRKLLNKSYNYIERLVNGEICGIPIYESKYDNYWEFGLCQESNDVCPTFHLDFEACQECIYCENCCYVNEVTLYWKDGYLGNKYIKL